jgi:hypothetical protein
MDQAPAGCRLARHLPGPARQSGNNNYMLEKLMATRWPTIVLVLVLGWGLLAPHLEGAGGGPRPPSGPRPGPGPRPTPMPRLQKLPPLPREWIQKLPTPHDKVWDKLEFQTHIPDRRPGHPAQVIKVDLRPTIERIRNGGPKLSERDGSVFENREGRLALKPQGYYRKYEVPTPGAGDAGRQRLIIGKNGELYYSNGHYNEGTIRQIR